MFVQQVLILWFKKAFHYWVWKFLYCCGEFTDQENIPKYHKGKLDLQEIMQMKLFSYKGRGISIFSFVQVLYVCLHEANWGNLIFLISLKSSAGQYSVIIISLLLCLEIETLNGNFAF